ncbi:TLP18.3, Psb32 and MOLO-1 founding proteins of phosphatase [Novymonas esmeraldas]|uniref:TLP18.3, Psb32 and MOLO-1 founding proteins of phosphatase n=1 Tax=Novymonas esmeraldas TaxID=1808958 RepID=A0AAW0EKE6_9TRYP
MWRRCSSVARVRGACAGASGSSSSSSSSSSGCSGGGAAAPAAVGHVSSSSSALLVSRRHASVDLLSPLSKLGQSRDLAADLKAGRQRNNREIVAALDAMQTMEEIHYRKTARPWELVPRYSKKRVTDLVGILTSEDRMEVEQTIDKMQSLCNTDMYVVIVPTVGYTTPRAFANSIFFNWAVGEPSGTGLLLLIAQREATVQLISGASIEEYFGKHFLEPAVREVFQPLVRDGQPSQATVQLVYAIARQAQEMHTRWEGGVLALPTRNKVRFAGKTVRYGVSQVPYLVAGVVFFTACTAWLVSQLLDTVCPKCHHLMNRVRDDATLQALMTRGQYLELMNGCAYYRVWKCPHCVDGHSVVLCSRDMHQNTKCLQCMDCEYYTCALEKEIVKLPSRSEDGLKRLTYSCANCHVGREVLLPLYRPVDTDGEKQWYDFLVDGSQTHKKANANLKL